MSKHKAGADFRVADGAGGLRPVTDHRFDEGPWLIELTVPAAQASAWMAHLSAECEKRGWSSGGISQIDAEENSGSLSVNTASGPSPTSVHIVWEKPRGGDLHVRARAGGTPPMSDDIAREFMDTVNERSRKGNTDRAHRWDMLTYDGFPWHGELWLGDDIRLGPPSRFPEALTGPQVVIVDAMVDGIGSSGIAANFQELVHELQIFLGVVLGMRTTLVRPRYGWVAEFDDRRRPTTCTLRSVGYWEVGPPRTFPDKGSCPPIARETVSRPGIGRIGMWPDQKERWVPDDIDELWLSFIGLSAEKLDHFLRAGNAYLNAGPLWPEQRTAYALFHVVACEALKPPGDQFDRLNIYDIVASLVGQQKAQMLKELAIKPQTLRSRYVHRGELAAGEFLSSLLADDVFADPSFDEMVRELSTLCRVCLVEWLRCSGEYTVVPLRRS